jgi:hypothetical protein
MSATEKTERTHAALVLPWDEAASRWHAEHPDRFTAAAGRTAVP